MKKKSAPKAKQSLLHFVNKPEEIEFLKDKLEFIKDLEKAVKRFGRAAEKAANDHNISLKAAVNFRVDPE